MNPALKARRDRQFSRTSALIDVGTAMTGDAMAAFGHFTYHERRMISALQRRAAHLETRVSPSDHTRSYDQAELTALRFALGFMAANKPAPAVAS